MSFNWDLLSYYGHVKALDLGGRSVPFDKPVKIEIAEVIAVDKELYTVDLITLYTRRELRDLDISGPAVDRLGGFAGYMPQVGDRCIVAFTSDEMLPRILTFVPTLLPSTGPRGFRRRISPGDYIISTSSGNYVHVAKGGLIDIAADPLTRRILSSLLHVIKDFAESYELHTAGGSLVWENARPVRASVGETTRREAFKRKSDGSVHLLEERGFVDREIEDDTNILTQIYGKEIYDSDGNRTYFFVQDIEGNAYKEYSGEHVSRGDSRKLYANTEVDIAVEQSRGSPSRARVRLSGDTVNLAEATSPATKADELKDVLSDLLDQLSDLVQTLMTNIATVSQAPGPGAGNITSKAAELSVKLAQLKLSLDKIVARDVLLS